MCRIGKVKVCRRCGNKKWTIREDDLRFLTDVSCTKCGLVHGLSMRLVPEVRQRRVRKKR